MAKESKSLAKVQEILRKYKGQPNLKVTLDKRFIDFELDSLDTVDLAMQIEDELHVKIEMTHEIQTIGDLVAIIDKQIKE